MVAPVVIGLPDESRVWIVNGLVEICPIIRVCPIPALTASLGLVAETKLAVIEPPVLICAVVDAEDSSLIWMVPVNVQDENE